MSIAAPWRVGLATVLAVLSASLAVAAAPVNFDERGAGRRLVTPDSLALYTFQGDQTAGASRCAGKCATIWPPFAAAPDASADGDFTVFTRDDGVRQWQYRGRPLYTYYRDRKPGDAFGDGVARKWAVAHIPMKMPPQAALVRSSQGLILGDSRLLSLYISEEPCDAACLRAYPPLAAPAAARPIGNWTIVVRGDGLRQWAFQGRALHRFIGDIRPRDTLGVAADGNWRIVVIEPPPPIPSWARYAQSDAEELLVDASGKTLYARDMTRANNADNNDPDGAESGHFEYAPESVMHYFKPVLAEAPWSGEPVGNWTIIDFQGRKHWAHRALPVYIHVDDKYPGELRGIKGTDRSYTTITRSGEPMQGTGR